MSKVLLNKCSGDGILVDKSRVSVLSEVGESVYPSGFLGFGRDIWYGYYFVVDGLRIELEYERKEDAEHERHLLV